MKSNIPATRAEARVAIAKDVLKQLRAGLKARTGNYMSALPTCHPTTKSKVVAREAQKTCTVCALGACFLSGVGLYNEYDFTKSGTYFDDGSAAVNKLLQFFTKRQIVLIEAAFEFTTNPPSAGWFGYDPTTLPNRDAASRFGKKYAASHDRLAAIMTNIVKNKGKFRP